MSRSWNLASLKPWIVVSTLAVATLFTVPLFGLEARQQRGLQLGSYDPYGTFTDLRKLSIEHIYLPWRDADLESLAVADRYAVSKDRSLVVTVEPWSWVPGREDTAKSLYVGMTLGKYDQLIANICGKLGSLHSKVTVRWGHEMDVTNGRYPWSKMTPKQYVELYQYFTNVCRQHATNLRYMWSPQGTAHAVDYYPGTDYVDVIGITAFALQEQDHREFGRDRSIQEVVQPVYQQVARMEKPVIVPEFGCHGDPSYMKKCYRDLTRLQTHFPKIEAVIYFNEKEMHAWPEPYGKPDWRVPAGFFADDEVAMAF